MNSPITLFQQIITIALCVVATVITRFLPFLVFSGKKPTPKYVEYLGKVLPLPVFGLLVVYSLKDTTILTGTHGFPELIAIIITIVLHQWKNQVLLSIAGGTVAYMLLVQFVFT